MPISSKFTFLVVRYSKSLVLTFSPISSSSSLIAENKYSNNMFNYIYFVKTDKPISYYKLQEEEVSEVKYISVEELKKAVYTKDSNYVLGNYISDMINILEEKEKCL